MRNKTKGIIAGALTLGTLTAIGLSSTGAGAGSAAAWNPETEATEWYTKLYGPPMNKFLIPPGCELMQTAATWYYKPSAAPFEARPTEVWKWTLQGTDYWNVTSGRDFPRWIINWYLCDTTVPTTTT